MRLSGSKLRCKRLSNALRLSLIAMGFHTILILLTINFVEYFYQGLVFETFETLFMCLDLLHGHFLEVGAEWHSIGG